MKGEKEFFRKRLFGGFNREDVTKYIAKVANERNEALEACEKAEKRAHDLNEELCMLKESINIPPVINESVSDELIEPIAEKSKFSVALKPQVKDEASIDNSKIFAIIQQKMQGEPTISEPTIQEEAPMPTELEVLEVVEPEIQEIQPELEVSITETSKEYIIEEVDALLKDVTGREVPEPKEPSKEMTIIADEIAQIREIGVMKGPEQEPTLEPEPVPAPVIEPVTEPEFAPVTEQKEEKRATVRIKIKKR